MIESIVMMVALVIPCVIAVVALIIPIIERVIRDKKLYHSYILDCMVRDYDI